MRTFCDKIHVTQHNTVPVSNPPTPAPRLPERLIEQPLPIIQEPNTPAHSSTINQAPSTPKKVSTPSNSDGKENAPKSPMLPNSEERKKTKAEKRAEKFTQNHAKKPKRLPNGPQTINPNKAIADHRPKPAKRQPSGKIITDLPGGKGRIVLFMPFLHYETDRQRKKMADAIKRFRIEHLSHTSKRIPTDDTHDLPKMMDPASRDDVLIEAYLNGSPPLHTRRTLDQFFYHGIDTTKRDVDQVVYRWCKRERLEPKIFMVDQLWMFILNNGRLTSSYQPYIVF
jgi:hypothetical protein